MSTLAELHIQTTAQLHKASPGGKRPHLCTEASEMVIGLVSSHIPYVTLLVRLEGDLTLASACQRSDDGETLERSVFLFLSLSQILEGSHHIYVKKEVCFLGFFPLSPPLRK